MPTKKQSNTPAAAAPSRRRLSPEARRDEIVSAAVALFAETGFVAIQQQFLKPGLEVLTHLPHSAPIAFT